MSLMCLQDSDVIHFLEEDSHTLFNLPVPTKSEETFENVQKAPYYLGIVTDKQFCLVKRQGTRYRVPVSTRFYRVKVKLLPPKSRTSSLSESEHGTVPCITSSIRKASSVSECTANDGAVASTSKANTDSKWKSLTIYSSLSSMRPAYQ